MQLPNKKKKLQIIDYDLIQEDDDLLQPPARVQPPSIMNAYS
jgi:hypothetical protein